MGDVRVQARDVHGYKDRVSRDLLDLVDLPEECTGVFHVGRELFCYWFQVFQVVVCETR